MPDQPQDPSAPSHLTDAGANLAGLFRRRLWEKEDQDFRSAQVKQFEKRVQQVGMRAANSTPDMDPDAPAEVPKEFILAAMDLKMAAAQYPNNPYIAKTADTYYSGVMNSVKELMGVDRQKSDVNLQGAQAQNQAAAAKYTDAERNAGKPAAETKSLIADANYKDRLPVADKDGSKTNLFLGLAPGSIQTPEQYHAALRRWATLPPDQGGPNQESKKQEIDSVRQLMAQETYSGMIGKPKNPDAPLDKSVWTVEEIAKEKIPFEDAQNRWVFEKGSQMMPFLGGTISPGQWKDSYGTLATPGLISPTSVSPGRPLREPTVAAITLGPDRIKEIETGSGKFINTVDDAIKALPENVDEMLYGDGPLPSSLSQGISYIEQDQSTLEGIKALPKGKQKAEITNLLTGRAYDLIDDTLKIPRGISSAEIPEATLVAREQSRRIANAAIAKYRDQIMSRLGLIALIKEEPKKGFSLLRGEQIKALGKAVDDLIPTGLINSATGLLNPEPEEVK